MNRKKEIQDRLKAIAEELQVLANVDSLSAEQELEYDALEQESRELEEELGDILSEEKRQTIRARADQCTSAAKISSRVTSPNPVATRITRQRLAIEDDPNRGFKTLAHFAAQILDAGEGGVRRDEKLMNVAAGTGMSQSVNDYGGVLVPPGFSTAIWDGVLRKSNSLLDRTTRIPVDPGQESITFPAIAETSRANGSRWGGVQGYWKGELTQMTESRPKLRDFTLKPQELYVFCYMSDKLLRNAPQAASQLMERAASDEIAFKIGDAIIAGDGLGKPTGIIGHVATKSIAKETNQTAATIVRKNINKMYAAMHANWLDGAVWLCNQEVIPALEEQTFDVGVGGIPVFLPAGGQSEAPFARLKGKPLIPIEYCPALGTVGDLIFCNLAAYATGVKGLVDRSYSMHLKFDYAQTAFRLIFEMDGQPLLNSVITPYKGGATYSPIVTLDTRA